MAGLGSGLDGGEKCIFLYSVRGWSDLDRQPYNEHAHVENTDSLTDWQGLCLS